MSSENLIDHLVIGSPLIWVSSPETGRVTETITSTLTQDLFMLNPFDGLMIWDADEAEWKIALIEIFDEKKKKKVLTQTSDFEQILYYVINNKASLIINHAHKAIDGLFPLFSTVYDEYRQACVANDYDSLPSQFIFLSHGDEIPPEIAKDAVVIEYPLPEIEEFIAWTSYVADQTEAIFETKPEDIKACAAAGLGLTEQDFLRAMQMSIRNEKTLNPDYINKFKLDLIKQSGVLEIRKPKFGLDSIGGLDIAKSILSNSIYIWQNPEEAQELKLRPINRILLVGVPGTGKSAICEAFAYDLGLDLAKTGVSSMLNSFIGESEKNVRRVFAQIRAMAPLVVWIDELGRDLSAGDWQGDAGTTARVHGEFLTGLQELPSNVALVCAANKIDSVAPEMLRADRFDKILFVGMPTAEERREIFKIHLEDQWEEFDLNLLAQATETYTGAEIRSLIKEVRFNVSGSERRSITTQDLVDFAPVMRNRIWIKHPELVQTMYQRAITEWDWASSKQLSEAQSYLSGSVGSNKEKVPLSGRKVYSSF